MRIRGGLVAVATVVMLGILVPGARAIVSPTAEVELLERTNAARAGEGQTALTTADDLVAVARRHAQRMADEGRIFHNSNLRNEVEGWQVIGENVGRAGSVAEVHDAFMASPAHRANIVEPRFTEAGMGIVDHNGELWVVEVFRQPMAAAASAPAPAPQPEARPRATPAPVAKPAEPVAARAPQPAAAPAPAAKAAPSIDRVVPALAAAPGAPHAEVQGRLLTVEARDPEQVGALALVALLLLALVATMTTKATVAELVASARR